MTEAGCCSHFECNALAAFAGWHCGEGGAGNVPPPPPIGPAPGPPPVGGGPPGLAGGSSSNPIGSPIQFHEGDPLLFVYDY